MAAGLLCLLAATAGGQLATPPPERSPAPTTTPASGVAVPWQELDYRARRFILAAHTSVKLAAVPSASVIPLLRTVSAGMARPPGAEQVAVLTLATDLPFGRDELVTLWLDPNGTVVQFDKVQTGSSSYRKLLRFTSDGYQAWRWAPADDREERLPPEGWTKRKERSFAWPGELPSEAVVTDPYALLYLVSAARLDCEGSRLQAVIFADDRPVALDLTALGLTQKRVDFEEAWSGGGRRRVGVVLARTVRLTAHVLGQAEGGADIDLGFLDMRGALTIAVEVGTGIPVELSGRTAHIGNLTVRLERAVLREPPGAPPATPLAPRPVPAP